MASEKITAKFQSKDENKNAILDAEGKPIWVEGTIDYDLGDSLDASIELFGADVVFSQFKSNARVAIQGVMRTKMQSGLAGDALQSFFNTYKLGVAVEKTAVDPLQAVRAMFATWPEEKQKEYIANLLSSNQG